MKKVSPSETTAFVYNANGQLVAEYSTQISQTPQVSYLTADHLGSPRVITDQNGVVTNRKDFSAFGEETTTPERTQALKYQPPSIRQDYTGYEKDNESGLEFAQARYYNAGHGRFTSVDPLAASASIRDPQTFNRYSYVLNSPYKFVDPLGLISASTGACGQWCQNVIGSPYNGGIPFDNTEMGPFPVWQFIYEVTQTTTTRNRANQIIGTTTQTWFENSVGGRLRRGPSAGSSDSETGSINQSRLTGPFVLDKSVVDDLERGNYPAQGNGDCAQLPQILLQGQMGLTSGWVGVMNVTDFVNGPPRGTVIATMDENQRYPGAPTGNHVAIFLRFERLKNGTYQMVVIDQYKGKQPGISKYKVGVNTPIPKVPSAEAYKDARTYWVVYRRVGK